MKQRFYGLDLELSGEQETLLTVSKNGAEIIKDLQINSSMNYVHMHNGHTVITDKNHNIAVVNPKGAVLIGSFNPIAEEMPFEEHARFLEFHHVDGKVCLVCKQGNFNTGFFQPRKDTAGFQVNGNTLRCLKEGWEVEDYQLMTY